MEIPESVKKLCAGNYTKYEIWLMFKKESIATKQFDTLIQADDFWKKENLGDPIYKNHFRMVLVYYRPDGTWYYQETVKGYNS
jgi:hypothetical protein